MADLERARRVQDQLSEREGKMRNLLSAALFTLAMRGVAAQAPSTAAPQRAMPNRSPATYHFAGIPWGSRAEVVTAALQNLGLTFSHKDSIGDLLFRGKVIDRDAIVMASMSDGKLARLAIVFASIPGKALLLYREVRRDLEE